MGDLTLIPALLPQTGEGFRWLFGGSESPSPMQEIRVQSRFEGDLRVERGRWFLLGREGEPHGQFLGGGNSICEVLRVMRLAARFVNLPRPPKRGRCFFGELGL